MLKIWRKPKLRSSPNWNKITSKPERRVGPLVAHWLVLISCTVDGEDDWGLSNPNRMTMPGEEFDYESGEPASGE